MHIYIYAHHHHHHHHSELRASYLREYRAHLDLNAIIGRENKGHYKIEDARSNQDRHHSSLRTREERSVTLPTSTDVYSRGPVYSHRYHCPKHTHMHVYLYPCMTSPLIYTHVPDHRYH